MKKIITKALLSTAIASSMGAFAASEQDQGFEVSANVALTSDYRFRGWSQTGTDPAIQGGFDIAHNSGFYAGVWGSNVDFDMGEPSNEGNMELDVYFGFSGAIGDSGIDYDLGYIYYGYPGSDKLQNFASQSQPEFDYQEIYASLSLAGVTAGLAYSDDYWLESGEFYYLSLDYELALPAEFNLALHYGLNNFDYTTDDTNAKHAELAFMGDGDDQYSDWSVGVSRDVFGVTADLSYVDTDVSKDACWGTDNCDSTLVFSLSKEF